MGIDDWSTDESQNLELDGSDISRRASPGAPANELTRKLMAHVKELEEKIVSDGIAVDGITIENNSGTLTVKDVAIDGNTTDLLTAKIEEIEAAATQAGEGATAAQTAATQAAASAASVETAVTSAATAANVAAEQADIAAKAAARAQSGAVLAESAVEAVIAGTNLNWQRSEKAGAVAVYPVPETALEPTVDFMSTETGPASGDKGPENPSTISGVSTVKVTRCGKNLYRMQFLSPTIKNGVTYSIDNDGIITLDGTATAGSSISFSALSSMPIVAGTTITSKNIILSGSYTPPSGGNAFKSQISVKLSNGNSAYPGAIDGNVGSTTIQNDGNITYYTCQVFSGATFNSLKVKTQIELGSTATAFDPYDGADYTIDLNGTCYGGSIDLATGVMAVTHVAVTPDASTVDISSAPAALPLDYADTYGRTITSADGTSLAVGSAGGTVVYKLATPQTVQLTPTQILSLAQTDKYTPRLNTVYTDASSVQVGYAKSPIRSEYELTQAIIATEGGE